MERKRRLYPLKGAHWFSRAYRKGRAYAGPNVVLYVLPGRDRTRTLLGITVSKKRGKAVTRNRVKRLLREAYRRYLPVLKNGNVIVIVAKQPAVAAGLSVLSAEVGGLLGKAALLDEEPQ